MILEPAELKGLADTDELQARMINVYLELPVLLSKQAKIGHCVLGTIDLDY